MKDYSVNIDNPVIEYSNKGIEVGISKEEAVVEQEIDVFYRDFFEKEEGELPVTIFSQELSPLQAIVKYLKEVEGKSFSSIAREINRDPRTIWATYAAVKNKKLEDLPSDVKVPLYIFRDRTLSTLESLVLYLLQSKTVSRIASLLAKNYQTIWTIKSRIKKKGGGAHE